MDHTEGWFSPESTSQEEDFALKQKRFKAEQIVAVLPQSETGVPLAELVRRVGVFHQTFYEWKE